jgi:rfaE bifunctional protein kinase chain/domain
MTPDRFASLTARYSSLRLAVVGDFCLDRYLEIDPTRAETSIETGLAVHNVTRVRAQPGAAGTVLNNLVALGVGTLWPVGFCGDDGEGYELRRALAAQPGVSLDYFQQSTERRTFTYCKPLLVEPGLAPRELSRLDSKNWTPTPAALSESICARLTEVAAKADAIIVMDQVDEPETGVITEPVRELLRALGAERPTQPILADSRRGLREYRGVTCKMNAAELSVLLGLGQAPSTEEAWAGAGQLARTLGRPVFVTMAERGILGALPEGVVEHVASHPVGEEIDVVGAGDSVTANLTAALAAGGDIREAMTVAMAAASLVIHQLGTTGTASVAQLREKLTAAG